MKGSSFACLVVLLFFSALPSFSQAVFSSSDGQQAAVESPQNNSNLTPSPGATAQELEQRADELRSTKDYFDAIDFFHAALLKDPNNARLHNKTGITELMLQHYHRAEKEFEKAIKLDHQLADAYNNLGVIRYEERKYDGAVKQYEKAISINDTMPSFYGNLGAAYYLKKDYDKASDAYAHAVAMDPDFFQNNSHVGISARVPSPQDRARFDYILARLYAKQGISDRCLEYLRRAMEDGYKQIDDVYKDQAFTDLRKDPRFTTLMASRPSVLAE
jgi:tetratricopeptide (TPR) repeat protein